MNHRLCLILVALLGFSGCGPCGTLEVEVSEADSARPIRGAVVYMEPVTYFTFLPPSVPATKTDEHGVAIFRPPQYHWYDVHAEFDGYVDQNMHKVSVDEQGRTYIAEGGFAVRADAPGETHRLRIEMVRSEISKPVRRTKSWDSGN